MTKKYTAILFDLDGTLLDTVSGLARSMDEVLLKHHFPTHTLDEYRSFIGNGIKALVSQSVPTGTDIAIQEVMYKEKSALYEMYWKEGTTIFPGIDAMLNELNEKNIPLAIFSNKEDHFTQEIVNYYFRKWKFIAVSGRKENIPKKPDPTGILNIIHATSIPVENWLIIGDKNADMEVAKNVGTDAAWASWGYQLEYPQPSPSIFLNTPAEVLEYV